MQSSHLASFKSSCLLVVVLLCCLSMAWAGVVSRRTPHNAQKLQRNLDTVASSSSSKSPSNTNSKSATTESQTRNSRLFSHNIIITPSQQRELLEKGETTIRLSSQVHTNQDRDSKKAFHRIVRRQTHRECSVEVVEISLHTGSCIRLGSNVTGCQTDRVLDLYHPNCLDV
ncbi:uncharacterized protein [Asterias amurensis]|uniref:uncharacterized protein n=1 Tax=Asterias amurensis TaxID=7602 RepID=UPI003AB13B8F